MMLAGLLAALVQTVSGPSPREVFRQALAAVEGDSVATVERRWSRSGDAAATLGLGALAQYTYRFPRADAQYRLLLARTPPGEVLTRNWARLGLARSAQGRGDFATADSLYRLALEAVGRSGDPDTELEILLDWAPVRMRRSGAPNALSLLDRADSLKPPGDPELRYRFSCAAAQVRLAMGRSANVTATYYAADSAARMGNRRLGARCLFIAASIIAQQGYHDSASAWLGRAAAWQRSAHDRSGLSASLQWLGFSLVNTGRYAEARPVLEEAIRDGRTSGNLSPVLWSHHTLAGLELNLGNLAAASRHAALADSLAVALGDQSAQLAARGMEVQQVLLFAPLPTAWAAVARLRQVTDRLPGGYLAQAYRSMAELSARERHWTAAETWLDSATTAAKDLGLRGTLMAIQDDRARLALRRGEPGRAATLLDEIIAGTGATQSWFRMESRTNRALAALRLGQVRQATDMLRTVEDSLDALRANLTVRDLQKAVFDIRDPMARGSPLTQAIAELALAGATDPAFEFAERRRARVLLDRLLVADASGPGSRRAAPPQAVRNTATLRQAIPSPDLAVVEYVLPGEGRAVVFVVTQAGVAVTSIGPSDSIAALVRRHRSLLEAGDPATGVGRRLAEMVLDPVLRLLPAGVGRVVIVADGAIHGMALDALPMADGRPVVSRFAVSSAPSLGVLARLWASGPSPRTLEILAVGDPAFDSGEPTSGTRYWRAAFDGAGGLPRLPASGREVRQLAQLGGHTTIRLGANASEAFLARTDLTRFRILHFATHALVDGETVARTALALVPGDGEDGFVTVAELARWKLDADLLTLSSCRTGQGVVAGSEGLQGLVSAALEAGARAVLATNWKLSDRVSADFVGQFYRAVAGGAPLDRALQATKLAWWRGGRPAREWAAYSLIGNGSTVIPFPAVEGR